MNRPPEERPIIHTTPRYTDDGRRDGVEWHRTMTDAKTFAKAQAKRLGHKGWTIHSLPFDAVKDLLDTVDPEHLP